MNSGPEFVWGYRHGQRGLPKSGPPRIRTYGIQFHHSCLMVVGRQDLNLRLPSPEACGLHYLPEYKANIFV
jgi:hypothetical protein